jgi:hypothetical protein
LVSPAALTISGHKAAFSMLRHLDKTLSQKRASREFAVPMIPAGRDLPAACQTGSSPSYLLCKSGRRSRQLLKFRQSRTSTPTRRSNRALKLHTSFAAAHESAIGTFSPVRCGQPSVRS